MIRRGPSLKSGLVVLVEQLGSMPSVLVEIPRHHVAMTEIHVVVVITFVTILVAVVAAPGGGCTGASLSMMSRGPQVRRALVTGRKPRWPK